MFETPFYPGSLGIISYMPVPTKHTLILLVTLTVLFYGVVNLFRRYYLERYIRDNDGCLYPVECKPTASLLGGLFSLSKRWGILTPSSLPHCTTQSLFAGWAQAFTQCGHFWKKLGEGMVTITYQPESDKYRLLMKTSADVVLINHELTKNMAIFKDENQGSYLSRWSAVDFATLQPRSETFCLRWNNLGVAESFNIAFMKCTQPACYTDADLYPLSADRSAVPSGCRRTDICTQWPIGPGKFVQTCEPAWNYMHPGCQLMSPTVPYTTFPIDWQQEYMPCPPYPGYMTPANNVKSEEQRKVERARSRVNDSPEEPSRMSSRPSEVSRAESQQSNLKSQPSRIASQPSRMGAQPSRFKSQPSRIGSQPSRMGAQPSRMGAQPSRMGAQPSRMGGQPSRMGGQPSRMGGQPSRMGKSKSRVGSIKSSYG